METVTLPTRESAVQPEDSFRYSSNPWHVWTEPTAETYALAAQLIVAKGPGYTGELLAFMAEIEG